MSINLQGSSVKLMCGNHAIAKMYCQGHAIYSSVNTVTYHVDVGVSYQEEVDEGASCLSPKSFAIPTKSGYTFVGWSKSSNGAALSSCIMGDEPITLYAVWKLIPIPSVITDMESAWTCAWTKLSGDNCDGVSFRAASVTCRKIDTSKGANCTLKSSTIPTNGCTKLVIGATNIFTSGTITVYGQNGANLGSLTSSDPGKTFDVSGYSGIYFYCVVESRAWSAELGWQPYGGVYLKA